MAGDNVGYTPGVGVQIAADGSNPDGALRQRVKIQTGVEGSAQDVASGQAMPTFDDSILLRRLVKMLETLTIVDSVNRQRITLDAVTAGVTIPTVTTVGTVTTVSTLTTITNAVPVGNIATIASMDREQFINIARTAYATGIRAKLN